ncbi:PorT family protein [Gramella lutea]|uniref:PorT family protein n=1 Tax=Christiangramia lutea TaxID=1607951 RepID=A0A9X2A9U1_9FLAO|nr:PorT family protein [Christiangramia lutea]MCH4822102.1 PorT family protein [Christiangramia lutea]
MKKTLNLVFAFIFLNTYSQSDFESGYFITETGEKVDCLIKNLDWRNNPDGFSYKLSSDSEVKNAGIETKEFGIYDGTRFERHRVSIDISSDFLQSLSNEKGPEFREDTLFLKALVKGEASLYLYKGENLIRYFYAIGDQGVKQLIYKRFKRNDKIARNSSFKRQLYNDLNCGSLNSDKVAGLDYEKKDLVAFFVEYNECTDSEYTLFESNKERDAFNLSIRPGLQMQEIKIANSRDHEAYDYGSQVNFRLGVELEYIMPFNNDKWSIILEPNYQYFNSEDEIEVDNVYGGILRTKIDYSAIEIPLGIRHYLFLSEKSKLFANIQYVWSFPEDTEIEFTRADGSDLKSLKISSTRNIDIGLGYNLLDKFSAEVRYHFGKDIMGDYVFWESDYSSFSVIVGYNLF